MSSRSPVGRGHDPELTYAQLAAYLGVSKRFLQARVAEGMPSCGVDYAGRRRVPASPKVTAWLDARQGAAWTKYDAPVIHGSPPHREEAI